MKITFAVAMLLAASLCFPCHAQSSMFGVNLVENGDAETGVGSPQCDTVTAPGWRTTNEFTVGTYGGRSDVLSNNSPGPPLFGRNARGKNFFCGGNGSFSQASQTIDISSLANTIDNENVKFNLSGWLGGDGASDDNATLTVKFNGQNSSQGPLDTAQLGPVKASDRSSAKSLVFRQKSGVIPAGTRSISIGLDMKRVDGKLNDAYADSISFVMNQPNQKSSSSSVFSTGVATNANTGSNIQGGSIRTVNKGSNTSSNSGISNSPTSSSNNSGGFAAGLGRFLGSFSAALSNTGTPNTNTGSSSSNSGFRNNTALSGVVHERGKTIITLDSNKMFQQGKWDLRPGTEQVLEQLRRTEFANQQQRPIFFEGHTDELTDNMDCLTLSAMRVLIVSDWMQRHGVDSSLFEVRGCGKSLPKTININGINRPQNRRIEIVLIK